MAHNSAHTVQPPFEIVLDDTCSIVCDDLPVNYTIRVMPVEGRSPPRVNPVSQWIEHHGRPREVESGRSVGFQDGIPQEDDYGPLVRDKNGKIVGSPIRSPPSPIRSRKSIVESVRRNIRDNNLHASANVIHTQGAKEEVFHIRKSNPTHHSRNASPHQVRTSSSSSNPQPKPMPFDTTDRLINLNRQHRSFKRTNIAVGERDLLEMHSTSEPQIKGPSSGSAKASSSTASQVKRCCAMADNDPSNYACSTADGDGKASETSRVGGAGVCTYHGSQPCPVRAGFHCRQNSVAREGIAAANISQPQKPSGAPPCKFHRQFPCPVLGGVQCSIQSIFARKGRREYKIFQSGPYIFEINSPDWKTPNKIW